ncbi:MAG: hypothetical protein ACRD10_01830, partial [Terriglobia bacterium]
TRVSMPGGEVGGRRDSSAESWKHRALADSSLLPAVLVRGEGFCPSRWLVVTTRLSYSPGPLH